MQICLVAFKTVEGTLRLVVGVVYPIRRTNCGANFPLYNHKDMPTHAFLHHQSVHVGACWDSGPLLRGRLRHLRSILPKNFEPTVNTDGEYLISFQKQFALNRILWFRCVCVCVCVSAPNQWFKPSDLSVDSGVTSGLYSHTSHRCEC